MCKCPNAEQEIANATTQPVTVPFAATPTREMPTIDRWAHPSVSTERMLTTLLEDKVRGGKWHTLYDKVMSRQNLFYPR